MTDCTCDYEHIRHATIGYPPAEDGGWAILRTKRWPDENCPEHKEAPDAP